MHLFKTKGEKMSASIKHDIGFLDFVRGWAALLVFFIMPRSWVVDRVFSQPCGVVDERLK